MPTPIPPPELWSIAVMEEPHPGRPIRICADERLRAGLLVRTLWSQGRPCAAYSVGLNYRCTLGGKSLGVSTRLTGDPQRDVVVRSAVTDIDAQETVYSRALHLRRLGQCPPGWAIGDATDQQGRRTVAAFVTGANTPAYPRP